MAAFLACASPCAAQTDPDELARRHFESGAAYFEQAEYDSALREFRKAYELSKRPQILRNISVVEERLGHLDIAVDALDDYLGQSPDDVDVETIRIRRNNLQKRLLRQREDAAASRAAAPTPAPPPPRPVAPAPPPAPPPLASVPEVKPTTTRPPVPPPHASAVAKAAPEPNASPPNDSGLSTAAYLTLGLSGAAAAGAVVTGLLAKNEHEYLSGECRPNCTQAETNKGEELALASTLLTGGAILSAGVAVVLFSLDASDPDDDGLNLSLNLTPSGGYASAGWGF